MKASFMRILTAFAAILLTFNAFADRQEYPRPQMERQSWQNLNGEWTYELDPVCSGWERGLAASNGFDGLINVPFAPECKLSGVEHKDFIPCIWYQRNITVPADWQGKKIFLNFGAVYYCSEIYVDGKFVQRHFGGSDSFSVDITDFVSPGSTHSLVVNATSDLRSYNQPAGKQSLRQGNFECMYTRTTGIWQTVWMEAVDAAGIAYVETSTDIDRSEVSFKFSMLGDNRDCIVSAAVYEAGKVVAKGDTKACSGSFLSLNLKKMKLWSPENPYLYDVVFTVKDAQGNVLDEVKSYFGMRKIHFEGNKLYLNNEPYYMRLVLDQGFYPDGIWTAPSDEALKHDIEMSKSVGFNGARLHQKVFEERFHYWADHLGYLTWGEFPSWGLNTNGTVAARNFITEWSNVVKRDMNHPSIVVWTPFNEEFWPDNVEYPRFISDVYDITKAIDPSRPINTVSGGVHVKTDIWTYHDYEQNADKLKVRLMEKGILPGPAYYTREDVDDCGNLGFNRPTPVKPFVFPAYDGKIPYIVDEFGGIRCLESNPPEEGSWGYGTSPETVEDFYDRLESQVDAILSISDIVWGYCYTQLTDVQQEQNGVFYFDRTPKYDAERLSKIFGKEL